MRQIYSLLFCVPLFLCAQPHQKTAHVFVITTDGFRWQELFQGADSSLLFNDSDRVAQAKFWSGDPDRRREMLMPFFWHSIAKKGQLLGNRSLGNQVNLKNVFRISYPGYNEILSGYPDPVLIPNVPIRNRNHNILGDCNAIPAYRGKVAAFTSWNLFPFILNQHRDRLVLNKDCVYSSTNKKLSQDERTFCNALEYIQDARPDLVFISFGATDHWAHQGNYGQYLNSASRFDEMVGKLWACVQADPYYRNQTTFIITTDHGRGERQRWYTHGPFSNGSGDCWLALIGPEVEPLGEIKTAGNCHQTAIAPTIARLLNFPFTQKSSRANELLSAFQQGSSLPYGQPIIAKQ